MLQPYSQQNHADIVNQKEIRVIGLRRSGNHAIINWIEKQQPGMVVHLNNIRVNENPYLCLYESLCHDSPYYQWSAKQVLRQPLYQGRAELLKKESLGDFIKKDCLICSYEDYSPKKVFNSYFFKTHDIHFGKSDQVYDVLILRDPFNLLASRLKNNMLEVKSWKGWKSLMDMWILYAKEYLGQTKYLKANKICVNYNQWFSDINYRKHLADKLNLEFTDTGFNDVSVFGGGSSFERRKFHGKAENMDILNRWKQFVDDSSYRTLFSEEVFEYSERIFGHIPGTESLRTKRN